MIKHFLVIGFLVVVFGFAALPATAAPLPPAPAVYPAVGSLGEADLGAPIAGPAAGTPQIDWEVIPIGGNAAWTGIWCANVGMCAGAAPPAGLLAYLYQGENTSTTTPPSHMSHLAIQFPTAGKVVGAGVLPMEDDLDVLNAFHPAHSAPPGSLLASGLLVAPPEVGPALPAHAVLVGEEEGPNPMDVAGCADDLPAATRYCIAPSPIGVGITPSAVDYSFVEMGATGKPPGHESPTLFITSFLPPVPGTGSMLNGAPSGWSTAALPGEYVPVPGQIPEPTMLILFGAGLLGLGLFHLRRSAK